MKKTLAKIRHGMSFLCMCLFAVSLVFVGCKRSTDEDEDSSTEEESNTNDDSNTGNDDNTTILVDNNEQYSSPSATTTTGTTTATTAVTAGKVIINDSSYDFALNSYSSDTTTYGFTALDKTMDNISVSNGTLTATETFFFKAPVENGNYKVTLTTNVSSVISECITDSTTYYYANNEGKTLSKVYTPVTASNGQPWLGITKKSISSGTAFEVAVCDGVLDLEFVYANSTITVSAITISKLSYTANAKPYLIAIGDSTTAQGDKTLSVEANNLKAGKISWGACISNGYVELSNKLGGFINCAESGGTVTSIYNDACIEKALLAVRPGDYVSVNIGINTNHKNLSIGGQNYDGLLGSVDHMGLLLGKYLIAAVKDRGGIPFVTTITPQGPESSHTAANNEVYYQEETTAVEYTNRFARGSFYGADYDLYAGKKKSYCAGVEYAVGDTIPAQTWHNSRHLSEYGLMLIDVGNYYKCDVVDLGVYGEKLFNESFASDEGFKTVQSVYHDKHHYKKALGKVFAKYMQKCVDEMIQGTYTYPYTDYEPNFVYIK